MSADPYAPTARAVALRPGGMSVGVAVAIGALVAVALGVFAKVHHPQPVVLSIAGFSSLMAVKSWLATLAVLLALFQMGSAMAMYGVLARRGAPPWLSVAHRWSGRVAVLASVPVAVHCLYSLGFASSDNRVLFHSIFGCFFYGVFVTKMLLLTRKGLRAWVLPITGGLVFFALIYLWLTSALWFFQINGVTL
jgi:hypothetical protein